VSSLASSTVSHFLQLQAKVKGKQTLILQEKRKKFPILYNKKNQPAQQRAHTPFQDMLPHHHTINNDKIILNVLTEL